MIRLIIIIVLIIVVLSYFNISVRSIINGEIFQDNWSYITNGIAYVWNTYLVGPASYLYNDIFIDLLWNSFIDNMKAIKGGGTPDLLSNPPAVPTISQ